MYSRLSQQQLLSFHDRASHATYAGSGKIEKQPERAGFIELTYQEGDYFYRDSYTGYYRSFGMEVIRYQGKPVWTSLYGGGMVGGSHHLAHDCFEFLKKALSSHEDGFVSVRGARLFKSGNWRHTYEQDGGFSEFCGYEEIFYKNKRVFFHRVIGGTVEDRTV